VVVASLLELVVPAGGGVAPCEGGGGPEGKVVPGIVLPGDGVPPVGGEADGCVKGPGLHIIGEAVIPGGSTFFGGVIPVGPGEGFGGRGIRYL
jgi:hypothetical protein